MPEVFSDTPFNGEIEVFGQLEKSESRKTEGVIAARAINMVYETADESGVFGSGSSTFPIKFARFLAGMRDDKFRSRFEESMSQDYGLARDYITSFFELFKRFGLALDVERRLGRETETIGLWASLNQALARDLFLLHFIDSGGAKAESGRRLRLSTKRFVEMVDALRSNCQAGDLGENLSIMLAGARKQAAVMIAAHESGCAVIQPSVKEEYEEWDVRNNVDLIIISPERRIYLVDITADNEARLDCNCRELRTGKGTGGYWQIAQEAALALGRGRAEKVFNAEMRVPDANVGIIGEPNELIGKLIGRMLRNSK